MPDGVILLHDDCKACQGRKGKRWRDEKPVNYVTDLPGEIWKPFTYYGKQFMVSNKERIKSMPYYQSRNEYLVKTHPSKRTGYTCVHLWSRSKNNLFRFHRVVATAFHPNPGNKPDVNHINGIKTDNRPENLEWVTKSENMRHAFDVLKIVKPSGENHYSSKLTNGQVIEIFNSNLRICDLCKLYNINRWVVSGIKHGKTWSKITGKVFLSKKNIISCSNMK